MPSIDMLESTDQPPLFFLHGESFTYAFGVLDQGTLCHLHWGGNSFTEANGLSTRLFQPGISIGTGAG